MKHLIATAVVTAALVMQPLAAHAGCTLYEHRDFQGVSWWLDSGEQIIMVNGENFGCSAPGCLNTFYEASWNDAVSSFDVDPGCQIRMFEHINEGGGYWWDSAGYTYVGDDWNDVVSQAQCFCS